MTDGERIVAVGLLTEQDLTVLGQGFRRVFRVRDDHDFDALLAAIDRAELEQQTIRATPIPPSRS